MRALLLLVVVLASCASPGWNHVDLDPDVVDVPLQTQVVHVAARTALRVAIERCTAEVLANSPVTDPAMAYMLCVDEMCGQTTRPP